jgi:hypothetical protein
VSLNPIKSWQERRMVDEAVDAYVDWRDKCRAVWDAYRRWVSASIGDAGLAFETYSAELDREEHAAEIYAAEIRRVAHLMLGEFDRATGPKPPVRGGERR